jgi:hypothetical protein
LIWQLMRGSRPQSKPCHLTSDRGRKCGLPHAGEVPRPAAKRSSVW